MNTSNVIEQDDVSPSLEEILDEEYAHVTPKFPAKRSWSEDFVAYTGAAETGGSHDLGMRVAQVF